MKAHLFRAHQIFHDKNMDDRNDLIWQYFTKIGKCSRFSRCNICFTLFFQKDVHIYKLYNIFKQHLMSKHPTTIEEIRREFTFEFELSWILKHFVLNTSNDELECKICCDTFNIFRDRIEVLENHLLDHGINKRTPKLFWRK